MPKRPLPRIEELWDEIFRIIYAIDDRRWPEQGPKLRELARLAQAAAAECEEQGKTK